MVRLSRLLSARLAVSMSLPAAALSTTTGDAEAQITGSLEKMIVELPNGCASVSTSIRTHGSDTFSFSYACSDQHDVVFTVSFPASVEAASYFGGWYTLAEPANASAAVSWQWTSPPSAPFGMFQGTSLGLYLGTVQGSAPCASEPVLRIFIPPGTYSSASSQGCALTGLASWNSGVPGDTVPWAAYWAEAGFTAYYTLFTTIFPTQLARARAIYRMGTSTAADLAVGLEASPTHVDAAPSVQVFVTNAGNLESAEGRVRLEVTSDEAIASVVAGPPATCTWGGTTFTVTGDCTLGSFAARQEKSFEVVANPLFSTGSGTTRFAVAVLTPDANPVNDTAALVTSYVFCGIEDERNCFIEESACSGPLGVSGALDRVGRVASSAAAALRALATSPIDLASYRRLRDEVMATTPAGRRLAALYDEHTAEVTALALADPDLFAALVDGLLLWQPLVQALVAGDGSAVITPAQAAALADALARLEEAGSAELGARIRREAAALGLPSLAGLTVDEARARLERKSLRRYLRPHPP